MLAQVVVAAVVSICNITIHAVVMTAIVQVARRIAAKQDTLHPSLRLTAVMIATVSVLMAAHTSEVLVWSLAYFMVGAVPAASSFVYFAFVNYTTLGYGDIVPLKNWQLLGPITAMNGILLFGWSTAVIFEVLRKAMALADQMA
jgi:hypothetical protein